MNTKKYDSMHRNVIFYALICINNHVLSCIFSMLSGSRIAWNKRERRGRRTIRDAMSGQENSSEARCTITKEKRAPNLGCDGGTKPAQVDASIKLLSITLQRQWVYRGWLTKIDLLI